MQRTHMHRHLGRFQVQKGGVEAGQAFHVSAFAPQGISSFPDARAGVPLGASGRP
jgi:hypothetical protein